MARYFFNMYSLGAYDSIFDDTGVELANRREIRLHMISTALALAQAEDAHRAAWEMEALDMHGQIVCTMSFGLKAKQD